MQSHGLVETISATYLCCLRSGGISWENATEERHVTVIVVNEFAHYSLSLMLFSNLTINIRNLCMLHNYKESSWGSWKNVNRFARN